MDLEQKLSNCITDPAVDFGIAVHHIETGENTFINHEEVFPTASVFKVPVMVEVFKQAKEGKFTINDRLPLNESVKTMPSGVLYALQEGLTPTVQDLLVLMIIISDNVATGMLLELVGATNITATMHSLGLDSTAVCLNVHEMFLHAYGIPDRTEIKLEELIEVGRTEVMDYGSLTFSRGRENNVSSAYDMVRLMTMIYKGEVVDREACDKMLHILRLQQYTGRVPRYLPWLASYNKTGTMSGLRNDSGIICCNKVSHVAYSIFSFDPTPLSVSDPRIEVKRTGVVENMMANIGEVLYEHYGGKF